jgi:hypothetical protein
VLGDKLATPLPDDHTLKYLPSPNALKGKILLKGSIGSGHTENAPEEEEEEEDKSGKQEKVKPCELCDELASLVYLKGVHFHDFKASESLKCDYMCSFSEAKTQKLLSSDPKAFAEFTKVHLARIYPAGRRMLSSNYDPFPAWNLGCQLVALNYQKASVPMYCNLGKFCENGQCGYVLKPPIMRHDAPPGSFDPTCVDKPFPSSTVRKLKVTVINARQLPKIKWDRDSEVVDPFVILSLHGIAQDCKKVRTKTIQNNGFNPVWNETFEFDILMSELALLCFEIKDADKVGTNKLAHYALPVESIRPGYRIIHPLDIANERIPMCNLLCHFHIE